MKREFKSLNNMSFVLPEGWVVSSDKYNLANGQGFFNRENYISPNGGVVSFFEIYQNGEEFLQHYKSLTSKFTQDREGVVLEGQFNIKFNGFSFPVFILKGEKDRVIYNVQVFIDCDDRIGCLMFYIDNLYEDEKTTISSSPLFMDVINILRSVQ